jgi:CRP/FNR family cyclic AMP-dependent transcriptional regulator
VDANRRKPAASCRCGSSKQSGDGTIHLVDGRDVRSGLDGPAHGDWPPGWSGRREDLDVLCSAPMLDGLDPQDVAALLPAFRFATVHVDQELITQGESGGPQMFIVLDGRFALTRRHRGGQAVTAVLGPGDSVGELNVFDPGRDTSTVRALTAARVAVLGGQDLLEWATTRPHAAARLLHVLARRLHRTNAALFDLAVLDVQRRVANALLDFATRFDEPRGNTAQVAHGLTQVQLAQLVGASASGSTKPCPTSPPKAGFARNAARSCSPTFPG